MSYYFNLDQIAHITERAVKVVPTANGARPNPAQWLPKSAVGIWKHKGQLILGTEGFFTLPPAAANWQQANMTAAEAVEMQRTAEQINLYTHMEVKS